MSDSEELRAKVAKWLQSEGYPLEYAAARAMRRAGFAVMQGTSYLNDDGRARDIDMLCQVRQPDRTASAVLECKASPSPWVALMREGGASAWSPYVYSQSWLHLPKAIKDGLTPKGRFGYSLVQAFKASDQDPAYTALNQVTNAARRVPEAIGSGGFAVPVLVVAAPLFTAWIGPDGNDEILPADWVRLVWSGSSTEGSLVDVVNVNALPAYASQLFAELQAILLVKEPSWWDDSAG